MRIILTHEQADFDAIASLLGAWLLDETAWPVLPRRMNRNVRSYLALYGSELPMIEARDLPAGAIEAVTLVDTQSLITLKGMGAETQVRVIDHHPARPGLPPEWDLRVEETGAATTLLVEAIIGCGLSLTPIQATLLLLGIYEDTGSLTYAHTSARDARAAAVLLEHGADLRTAIKFLNPPLSSEQREVYERLLTEAATHQFNGYRVVVATGDATGSSEEISSLTHKLRDVLDPDALFVLVETDEGIRLVARSTSDGIDVSAVAAHFGGGGHDRAAAALVRPESNEGRPDGPQALEAVEAELLRILPRIVRPSISVAQIMSKRPRLLAPETPVGEAVKLMQKYGYEGFPVVRGEHVVGLLTRRAVDRAVAHKLNLTASSLMEAGEVTVRPEDALQHLQAVMTDSGWGQVPVVDEAGCVIGIVTRTDLLKTLAPRQSAAAGTPNLAGKLERALPPDRLALLKAVIEAAAGPKTALYIVGGFVRDLLLDRPSLDFDIVVEGNAIALAKTLARRYGGRVMTHGRFGTAKWDIQAAELTPGKVGGEFLPHYLDFISARQEFYEHPSALPTVERGSIKLDLHRRDFTINTLALRLDGRHYGELLDYWGGLADLNAGMVRVLHSLSFVDDPTRMLRAVRFEQRFGFQVETRTRQLMDEARPGLEKLSGDRIRHELNLILAEERAAAMLARLADLGLLAHIHPALPWDEGLQRLMEAGLKAQAPQAWGVLPDLKPMYRRLAIAYLLWLGRLPAEAIQSVCNRLRLPLALRSALLAARDLQQELPALVGAKPSEVFTRLEDVPLLAAYTVWLDAPPAQREVLDAYIVRWRTVQPCTSGDDLKRRGLPPGPSYQMILRRLRQARLDGEVSTDAQEHSLLETLLKEK
ncbi:MAG: CBS domain-containing protein [Anaerolineales bacterium]|nr:CBS domain-containing protein [Anaerolineales bacterium]